MIKIKTYINGKKVSLFANGKKIKPNNKPITPPQDIPVTIVTINNKITTLTQNLTHQLNVNVLPTDATDKALTYLSSNDAIATVTSTGLITAKTTGSCIIAVKSNNNISDIMNLTVQPANIPVTSISLNKSVTIINNGNTEQLTVTVLPDNATNKNVTWSSSNIAIATVDNGLITSKGIGNCIITVTTQDCSKTATCNVTVNEISSELLPPITRGIVSYSDALDFKTNDVIWADRTGNGNDFTISASTSKVNGFIDKPAARNISHPNTIIQPNSSFTIVLSATNTDSMTVRGLFTQRSGDNGLFFFSQSGVLKMDLGGSANRNDFATTFDVGYCMYSVTFDFSTKTLRLYKNNTMVKEITNAKYNSTLMTDVETRILASDTFQSAGKVGSVITYNEALTQKEISQLYDYEKSLMREGEIKVNSIEVVTETPFMYKDETKQLTANVLPTNATNKAITWGSGNEALATVNSSGMVASVETGVVTIYAYAQDGSGKLGEITLTILSADEEIPEGVSGELKTPYISTYNYKYKPYANEEIIVPFYITDYDQVEYLNNDDSFLFTVRVELDGKVIDTLTNLKAGDHSYNFGALTEGEHYFAFQVTDNLGRYSNRLYNDVLVVPSDYDITESQIYTVTTADLTKHSINKNNSTLVTDMVNNKLGLTALFNEVKNNGYRKCILPQGVYRVNRTERYANGDLSPISIPSNFTVDFNGATVKLHPYSDAEYGTVGQVSNVVIRIRDCYDSHVENIVIEGDYAERQANGWLASNNGEPCNTIVIHGGKFCSVKNSIIKQTTGYTVYTVPGTNSPKVNIPAGWLQNTNIVNGVEVTKANKWTSDYTDISSLLDKKYVVFSVWLGNGVMRGETYIIDIHFYDDNKNFIETIRGFEFRKTRIPNNAKYARVTYNGKTIDTASISCHYMQVPSYLLFENVDFYDTRTCSFAPAQFSNFEINNCTFTRSGQSVTPAAIDFEDGWEQAQDFFMTKCRILEASGTRDFIDNAGLNHVIEECDGLLVEMRNRCHGYVFRNNTNMRQFRDQRGEIKMNGYKRITENTIDGGLLSMGSSELSKVKFKNCIMTNTQLSTRYSTQSAMDNLILDDCIISDLSGDAFTVINSTINSTKQYLGDMRVLNCTINAKEGTTTNTFSFNKSGADVLFDGNTYNKIAFFYAGNVFNSGTFENEIFNDEVKIETNNTNVMGDIQYNNCIFKKNITIKTTSTTYVQFNNCTFEGGKVYQGNASTNCQFNNCVG